MHATGRAVCVFTIVWLAGCSASESHQKIASPTTEAKSSVSSPFSSPAARPVTGRARTSAVSVSRFGDFGVGDSDDPLLSANGRFVAFVSSTDDLVAADTNGREDVFVRDTKTGVTRRVDVSAGGAQGNGIRIIPPSVSIDSAGRYVAFQTDDTNLVPGTAHTCTVVEPGTQPCPGIYVRDLQSGSTRLLNVSDSGALANGYSQFPVISSDGRYVAFLSGASNLVPGDTNNATDVFVADLKTSTIRRISVSTNGVQADGASYSVSISATGRYIAFTSAATTLAAGKPGKTVIGVFLRDLQAGTTRLVGINGIPYEDFFGSVTMSPNGRYLVFDSRAAHDTLIRDMQTGTVKSLSAITARSKGAGFTSAPVFDATGRYLAFTFQPAKPSTGDASVQVLMRDLATGTTRAISVSNSGIQGDGGEPAISGDGRYIAFSSRSAALSKDGFLPGTEIFLRGPLN